MSIRSVVRGKTLRRSAAFALLTLVTMMAHGPSARAQGRAFERSFTANLPGQLVVIGNSVVTCDRTRESNATCNAVETGQGPPNLDNDSVATAFIDIDGNDATFNSSAATLQISGDVEWAGLYWWGSIDPVQATRTVDTANRDQVLLQVPGGSYAAVASDWGANGDPLGNGRLPPYLRFANVTQQVKAGGAGSYQVGNVVTFAGQDDHLGGWSLVVVNRDPTLPSRHISIYDGYRRYGDGEAVNITIENFLTPLQGPLDAQVSFIALDGDAGKTDSVTFNGQSLTNALNPAADFGNSTISRNGELLTARSPAFVNTLGTDIDTYNVSSLLTNGATSATATFSGLAGETNFAAFIGFQTTLYAPEVDAEKSATDVNAGQTVAGDVLEYTVTVRNAASANDTAVLLVLEDPIPPNTTYVPGSLELVTGVAGGAMAGPLTDAAGDDTGEYLAPSNKIVVRLGAAATATTGGALLPGQSTTVKFRVTINPALAQNTTISNQATISFQGLTLSQNANSGVITITSNAPMNGGPTTTPVSPADTDGDGLPDVVEDMIGTNKNDADSDDDGLLDGEEPSFNQDSDNDGMINALDPDSDNDGLFDGTEAGKGCGNAATDASKATCRADADPTTTTSPTDADTDDGGVTDGAEDFDKNGRIDPGEKDPNNAADDVDVKDSDNDGIPDDVETVIGTNPNDADSDDDGLKDGEEPAFGQDSDGDGLINALDPDSDDDGIFDGTEAGKDCSGMGTSPAATTCVPDADMGATKTDPLKKDTDNGGKPDGAEDLNRNGRIDAGETDPNNAADDNMTPVDTDMDGLPDDVEDQIGSNPNDADSDDDGLLDGEEANPTLDTDGDGLINILDPDSDDDGLFDGTEAGKACDNAATNGMANRCVPDADMGGTKTSPLKKDTDDGGKPDGAEDVNRNGRIDAGETDPNDPADDNVRVDTDMDGLTDDQEQDLGSNPNDADSDDDGLLDGEEPNPSDDADGDGTRNILDPDSDGDGLFDGTEAGMACGSPATDAAKMTCVADADPTTTTSVVKRDTDDGGVPDGVEDKNRDGRLDPGEGDPNNAADDSTLFIDTDMDGVSDDEEKMLGSDPNDADTDDDGVRDGDEQNRQADPDMDGLINVRDPDSDNDGLFDGTELGKGCSDPGTDATKMTCIADADMGVTKTNPENPDTDGGTVADGLEDTNKNGVVDAGERDPLNAADDVSVPPGPSPLPPGIIAGGGFDCSFDPGRTPSQGTPLALMALGLGLALFRGRKRR